MAKIAAGDGWTVSDLVCTSGPGDRPFEEQHSFFQIAIVAAGTFQYRSRAGSELMTPGSLLLGTPGDSFECGHEHGVGDRCISFAFSPEYFDRLGGRLGGVRVPPLRKLSAVIARACAGLRNPFDTAWDEIGMELAGRVAEITGRSSGSIPAAAEARVTRAVRYIEQHPHSDLPLKTLASESGLSAFHFLRMFQQVTGSTPHQYVLRNRLREAALRLSVERGKILDIAFDCGFGDISNFNRSFRKEFGVSPRMYRSAQ